MDPLSQPPNSKFSLLWKTAHTLMVFKKKKKDIAKRRDWNPNFVN